MSKIFLCFTGTDGSGKSTLSEHIFHRIKSKDKKVKKIYGRYEPVLIKYLMVLGRRLFLDKKNKFTDYDSDLKSKISLFKKASIFSLLYIRLIILEYYFELLIRLVIPYRLGYSIISDRYVYDTIINDIAIDMQLTTDDAKKLLTKFWFAVPKPDITFLIKVPETVAIRRKGEIPSLSYLKTRNKFYNELAASEDFVILDGTLGITELEDRVLQELRKDR